jgi:hypothetical protein
VMGGGVVPDLARQPHSVCRGTSFLPPLHSHLHETACDQIRLD